MRIVGNAIGLVLALLLALGPGPSQAARRTRELHDAPGDKSVEAAQALLAASLPVQVVDSQVTAEFRWVELDILDEAHPLTVDLLGAADGKADKMIIMLPVSGMNFRASFLSQEQSLAQYFRALGYLVVGITPREDHLLATDPLEEIASWGVAKHTADVRRVVDALGRMPLFYDILGHSFSAATALDFAATTSGKLDRVLILDFYGLDPSDPLTAPLADRLHAGFVQLLEMGVQADTSLSSLRGLILGAAFDAAADSGVARSFLGQPGNFTLDGLLHFWLIYTGALPGVHTSLTGLPNDWPLILSTLAGWYQPALDPAGDTFGFTLTDPSALLGVAFNMGSGVIPLAYMRDVTAIGAQSGAYPLDYAGIDEEVVWVNTQLGYGDMTATADAIRAAGNAHVSVHVVPGYGNGDCLYGTTAVSDVWPLLAPRP
jgi:pimeloyl-ACP methyl ester carboxylesterase